MGGQVSPVGWFVTNGSEASDFVWLAIAALIAAVLATLHVAPWFAIGIPLALVLVLAFLRIWRALR